MYQSIIVPIICCSLITSCSPQISGYCNYPIYGESDSMPIGFELKAVVALIRHGERSSFEDAPYFAEKPDYDLNFGEDDQLFRGYTKFWNQYRAMLPSVPFELSDIRQGFIPGILTPRGIIQTVRLGRNMKHLYNNQWFEGGKKVGLAYHIESTSFARTYHSALAFMYGLLGHDAIGVAVSVNRASTRFCSHSWCKCKNGLNRFRNVLNQLYNKYYNEFLDSKTSSIIEDGNRILLNGGSSTSLSRLIDFLLPYACRPTGNRLPCSSDADRCFSVRDFRTLNDFGDKIAKYVSGSEEGRLKGLVEAIAVFQKWRKNILRVVKNNANGPRFELYSDHETTLIAVLIGLGVFDGVIPPMASSIRMEVWQHLTSGKSYMKVFYNGLDYTGRTKFCKKSGSQLCDVEKFLKFLSQYVDENGEVTSLFKRYCEN